MSETPLSDAIRFQWMSWQKRKGRAPVCLVVTTKTAKVLWKECLPFVMKHKDLKFENPINQLRQFMGMNVVEVKEIYGGTFEWGFGE